MTATRFMRIPFFVTGYLVTEDDVELGTTDNLEQIAAWCEGHVIRNAVNPFVRVPVSRATNRKQTEAYVGTWVVESEQRGDRSFKVYTEEWLLKQFFKVPEGVLPEIVAESMVPASRPAAPIARPLPTQRNVADSPSKGLSRHGHMKNVRTVG